MTWATWADNNADFQRLQCMELANKSIHKTLKALHGIDPPVARLCTCRPENRNR